MFGGLVVCRNGGAARVLGLIDFGKEVNSEVGDSERKTEENRFVNDGRYNLLIT